MVSINNSTGGVIARIEVANPARHNAMSLVMWKELALELEQIERKPAIRVVSLRGAGDKAFVSGGGISEFDGNRNNADNENAYDQAVQAAERALMACIRPVVVK